MQPVTFDVDAAPSPPPRRGPRGRPVGVVVHRLDDRRPLTDDGWSCLRTYRAGEDVLWRGRPWESLHMGNSTRPEVVVEGHLYVSESWAPVWDETRPNET